MCNSGKLPKYLRSEKLGENHSSKQGNLHNLIGEDFEKFILNEEKWIVVFVTRKRCVICDEVKNKLNY